jgi:CheY-like chemotaxis protein
MDHPDATGAAERARMRRQHVFAVDGAVEFLDVVRALLREERYNVTTTNLVPEAYDQIASLNPDLLIIDLAVGVQAGWDLLERVHGEAATRGIPVIVTSTDPLFLRRAEEEAARYGTHRYLAKPFDLEEFLTLVTDLIGPA